MKDSTRVENHFFQEEMSDEQPKTVREVLRKLADDCLEEIDKTGKELEEKLKIRPMTEEELNKGRIVSKLKKVDSRPFTFYHLKKTLSIFQVMHTELTKNRMIMLYGTHLGEHLWNKRETYAYGAYLSMHDEEKFFESMDEGNQRSMFYWACTFLN